MSQAERRVPPGCMDPPALHAFVDELRGSERFRAFVEALPTRARVPEPVLPLLLAAAHAELARPLVCLFADDADARDAAEAAGWFLADDRVALLPSRGVRWGSGLEPPPHLVGERARALDVLEAGGLVCASAAAIADGLPPLAQRPRSLRLSVGDEPGIDAVVEHLALAGYERTERVEDRGTLEPQHAWANDVGERSVQREFHASVATSLSATGAMICRTRSANARG